MLPDVLLRQEQLAWAVQSCNLNIFSAECTVASLRIDAVDSVSVSVYVSTNVTVAT